MGGEKVGETMLDDESVDVHAISNDTDDRSTVSTCYYRDPYIVSITEFSIYPDETYLFVDNYVFRVCTAVHTNGVSIGSKES